MNERKLSILLVDDDEDDQFFFKEALHQIKIKVDLSVAYNGLEALNTLTHFIPELIFLDINMPYQNGKECLKVIRSNPKFQDTSIIMFTTSAREEDIRESRIYGANLFVIKPSSTEDHVNILNNIFSMYLEKRLHRTGNESFVINHNSSGQA
jgi:CheY-like chemotaxis protein